MEKKKKAEEMDSGKNSYSHILKYTGLFGGVQGLNILVGVVRNKFTAMFLGPSGMGLLALFNSTSNFLTSATNLGIPTSGVRVVSEADGFASPYTQSALRPSGRFRLRPPRSAAQSLHLFVG